VVDMNEQGWMIEQLSKESTPEGLRIADRIEHAARNISGSTQEGPPDYSWGGCSILGEINTMHGTMSTSNLLNAAADADGYARKPERYT
jgi:hypothetical protein